MFVLFSKLKSLKSALRSWNVNVFGNVYEKVKNTRAVVDDIQS